MKKAHAHTLLSLLSLTISLISKPAPIRLQEITFQCRTREMPTNNTKVVLVESSSALVSDFQQFTIPTAHAARMKKIYNVLDYYALLFLKAINFFLILLILKHSEFHTPYNVRSGTF